MIESAITRPTPRRRCCWDHSPIHSLERLTLPAQPVDATPSNALIRQYFPGRSDLFGCPRSKPSQRSVPADLTLASDLAFVFNASRVRFECCVDPLRPPDLPGARSPRNQVALSSRLMLCIF